jgi:hypothetical protein
VLGVTHEYMGHVLHGHVGSSINGRFKRQRYSTRKQISFVPLFQLA